MKYLHFLLTSLEVSRLTRSTQKLCEIIKKVQEKQIKLVIAGSITIDCSPGKELDAISKGMMLMWGVDSLVEQRAYPYFILNPHFISLLLTISPKFPAQLIAPQEKNWTQLAKE